MKRKTVLKRLHSKIKSFSQITPEHEYHMMKDEDGSCIKESILFTNIDKTPYKIPKDYGQGIKVEYNGKMMTSIKSNSDKPYKKCNMDCTLGISNDYNGMQVLLHLNCRIALIIRIIFVIMLMKIKRG